MLTPMTVTSLSRDTSMLESAGACRRTRGSLSAFTTLTEGERIIWDPRRARMWPIAGESPKVEGQVPRPIVPTSALAPPLRKVRESVVELEARLKRFEAERGEERTGGQVTSRPTPGGPKSGRRPSRRRG